MRVLMAVASKHGSTSEIAAAIAEQLTRAGATVEIFDVAEAPAPTEYDAAIIGSAIYMGHWLAPAREYIERHQTRLRAMPVWLFSSGPIGDDPDQAQQSSDVPTMIERTGARAHATFPGKLDRATLGMGERLITALVRAPEGDFRNWDDISAWANDIASALHPPADASTRT